VLHKLDVGLDELGEVAGAEGLLRLVTVIGQSRVVVSGLVQEGRTVAARRVEAEHAGLLGTVIRADQSVPGSVASGGAAGVLAAGVAAVAGMALLPAAGGSSVAAV
jgi:hypothetical protein